MSVVDLSILSHEEIDYMFHTNTLSYSLHGLKQNQTLIYIWNLTQFSPYLQNNTDASVQFFFATSS